MNGAGSGQQPGAHVAAAERNAAAASSKQHASGFQQSTGSGCPSCPSTDLLRKGVWVAGAHRRLQEHALQLAVVWEQGVVAGLRWVNDASGLAGASSCGIACPASSGSTGWQQQQQQRVGSELRGEGNRAARAAAAESAHHCATGRTLPHLTATPACRMSCGSGEPTPAQLANCVSAQLA